ncbi:MAG: hypothetical protein U0521_16545 [Anaerolineae bacterium]
MSNLNSISAAIRSAFVAKNSARDTAIAASRELIRHCSEAIRAVHRREWDAAEAKLAVAQAAADDLRAVVANYPDLAHSSYQRRAQRGGRSLRHLRHHPRPAAPDTGVAQRRWRHLPERAGGSGDRAAPLHPRHPAPTGRRQRRSRTPAQLDAIYDELVTFDFPDAITGDLRRRTDVVRGAGAHAARPDDHSPQRGEGTTELARSG